VTDHPEALDRGIEGVRMPEMGLPLANQRYGCWPKLSIFSPGVLPADEPTLYLDLDVVVRKDLDVFFDRIKAIPGFHSLREWNPTLWRLLPIGLRPNRGVQGSILGFIPRNHYDLYERFMANATEYCQRYQLDQDYLTDVVSPIHYWPYQWTVSFKWHCCQYYPLDRLLPHAQEPKQANVVVFHGNPRPIDIVPLGNYRWGTKRKFGFGPVDWVRDYWIKNDPTWVDDCGQRKIA
jgi:hypothetical protein